MQFTKLLSHLNKHPDLFLPLLGLTQQEFTRLDTAFKDTKSDSKDRTRRVLESDKLLASLLISRYQLSNDSVKSVLFDSSKLSAADITSFVNLMNRRLSLAVRLHPLLINNIDPARSPLMPRPGYKAVFHSLDALVFQVQQATTSQALITSKPLSFSTIQAWLGSYLQKPVTNKNKTGQAAFMQLLGCLQYDAAQFNGEEIEQVRFIASALNYNMHNASYSPTAGFGKSQAREMERPLFYSRSQVQSPHGLFFKFMTAPLVAGKTRVSQCIMPHNAAAYKIIGKLYETDFTKKLTHYDKYGFLKPDYEEDKKKMGHFAPTVGHSGLSQNTYTVMIKGLTAGIQNAGFATFFTKVVNHVSEGATVYKPFLPLNPVDLQNQYGYSKSMLQTIADAMKDRPFHGELQKKLNQYKRKQARNVLAGISKLNLNNVLVSYDRNTFTLDVKFYPNAANIPDNSNYKEGVTNVILCFFTALFNHHCAKQGLFIQGQRRQSFGFNRTSITDIGSMTMRVSLGYESEGLVTAMVSSLTSLDRLLRDHNFLNKNSPTLRAGFIIAEKSRSKDKTKAPSENTGNKFRKIMRSEANMLRAIQTAESLLLHDKTGDESIVFASYIRALVAENFVSTKTKALVPVTTNNPEAASAADNIIIIGLLNNVLKFSVDLAIRATHLIEHDNISSTNVYHFLLSHISKYAFKAHALLENHTRFRASHIHAKAILLIEDMLEIITLLDSLAIMHIESDEDTPDKVWQLANTEQQYLTRYLDAGQGEIEVFFTDNGQQALMMSYVCVTGGVEENGIYLYKSCYYELPVNMADNLKIPLANSVKNVHTAFVDIRDMHQFKKDIIKANQLKRVIIDCTHNPCISDNQLKNTIHLLREKNILVVIVASMLKHEQLGMDKFQAGKIITISPKNHPLPESVRNELAAVTRCAMEPLTASFFQMMNEITRDKVDFKTPSASLMYKK